MNALRLLLLLAACLGGSAGARPDDAIVQALRQGGYVLYLRHTSTDFAQNDTASRSYEDCANQRNLTDKGRDEARAIAKHLRALGIPVGSVLASPWCRTMETARLAFGKAQASAEVRGGPARTGDPGRYEALRKILSSPVAKGENLAISSHGNPFHAVAGPPYLAEGEVAVVRPEGDGRFSIVARIRLEDWSSLRAGAARAS